MSSRAAVRLLPSVCLAACLWGGPVCPTGRAQQANLASESTLNSFTFEKKSTFAKLLRGEEEMKKADLPLVELAAKFYVQRVALLAQQKDTKALRGFVAEFESGVVRPITADPKASKRQVLLTALSKELVKSFQQVLNLDMKQWRAGVLHASLMLEPLGQTGQPEVGDFLAGLLKNAKHDVIKLFALKGLREYFQARPPKIYNFTEAADRVKEAARIEAVLDFLARPAPKGSEEEVAAYKFIRREAVRALAASRIPVIPVVYPGDKKETRGLAAHGLVRVLVSGKDALDPPTTLSERIEAAIGLCQMKAEIDPQAQADLVVGLVGKTLVEFAQKYRDDQAVFAAKEPGRVPLLPWKFHAERLKQALKDLQANLPAGAAKAKAAAQALDKEATAMLDKIRSRKALDEAAIQALQDAVRGLPRPPGNVYEGLKEPHIELGQWPPLEG
jgi:hypothetical protein